MSPPRQGSVHKVRLLDSEWAWVNEEAERRGVSAAEVVRVAVREMRRGREDRERLRVDPGSVVRFERIDTGMNPVLWDHKGPSLYIDESNTIQESTPGHGVPDPRTAGPLKR